MFYIMEGKHVRGYIAFKDEVYASDVSAILKGFHIQIVDEAAFNGVKTFLIDPSPVWYDESDLLLNMFDSLCL